MVLQKKLRNVRLAMRAVRETWRTEPSFRVQVVATLLLFALAAYTHISKMEWALLILALSGVLTVELVNTAIERTCDAFGRTDPHIGLIKDLGAAAASVIGFGAILVSCIIFVPRIVALL